MSISASYAVEQVDQLRRNRKIGRDNWTCECLSFTMSYFRFVLSRIEETVAI
jgi:hypothetical protein